MCSIGKVRIKKLKAIVLEEIKAQDGFYMGLIGEKLDKAIKSRIPSEWYDISEGAFMEIDRIVDDTINDYKYN